jgi:hypothetical protein
LVVVVAPRPPLPRPPFLTFNLLHHISSRM